MSNHGPDHLPTRLHPEQTNYQPISTKITIGEDTYTIDTSDQSIKIIRRSARWKKGGRGKRSSTSTDSAQSGSASPDLSSSTSDLSKASPDLSKSSSVSPDPDCRIFCPSTDMVSGPPLTTSAQDLPSPDSPQACKEASNKLNAVISSLREDGIEPDVLISNLEYIGEVLGVLAAKADHDDLDDELSELASEAVPDDVRKWLASTFAKPEQISKKSEERPTLRSVANAIRTGIFIEKIYSKMSTSQMMVIPPEVEAFLKTTDNWSFDIFNFAKSAAGSPLKYMGYHLMQEYGCFNKYKIPPSILETLLGHLEIGYYSNGNPYHNNIHAADVLQTTHWMISQTGLKDWLSDLEIFALLFSAIIHDFDHSGTTNNFHIQSNSNKAILYNDRSVLENHHVAAFFRTMIDNECNILNNMSKQEFREFRSLMIEMVLHTDMSMHFTQLKLMKGLIQTATSGGSKAFKQWKKIKHGRLIAVAGPLKRKIFPLLDKTKVLCMILHSCDVSHPAKSWPLHKEWTARCMEEFFKQGDMEQELGLDFSPLCDRQNTVVPQSQMGFIDFIVSPTFDVCGDMINLVLDQQEDQANKPWVEVLEENKESWQSKAKSGEIDFEESDAANDVTPPKVVSAKQIVEENGKTDENETAEENTKENGSAENGNVNGTEEEKVKEEPDPKNPHTLDNSHLIKQIGPITIDTQPPDKPTKHKDVVGEVPSSVLSRPGSPVTWNFGVKESITVAPPRPNTASLLSPPERRRAPISVDHTLRKHALDF